MSGCRTAKFVLLRALWPRSIHWPQTPVAENQAVSSPGCANFFNGALTHNCQAANEMAVLLLMMCGLRLMHTRCLSRTSSHGARARQPERQIDGLKPGAEDGREAADDQYGAASPAAAAAPHPTATSCATVDGHGRRCPHGFDCATRRESDDKSAWQRARDARRRMHRSGLTPTPTRRYALKARQFCLVHSNRPLSFAQQRGCLVDCTHPDF
ncbi:hypothetical protein FB451DRAFT_1318361 [Mycena latifolia]|nr:hypothetical protein FB451DRAFT_1318361 [Mycena latifolia]